ncbi:hypothetical protein [Catellatospora citrea]|uniref:hypothetical protein n=1 Tax=Catellatospora citrea TaxID=53366 RepID=UPI0011C3CBEF|nr:hypothetical protein [Catellatospora citrea]
MISMRLNEAAASGLGYQPFAAIPGLDDVDAGELATRMAAGGLARDELGGLIIPGLSFKVPDFAELTYRETQRNSWHLDDHPAVHVEVDDEGGPRISHEHQLHMLKQGILLSRLVLVLAAGLPDRPPLCCITSANDTNGVFRFHQLRPGETWLQGDLDLYAQEMLIVVESRPTGQGGGTSQPA